ncbi:MAG: sensor histidine kinase [Gammaproteobacteria bacterium]
MFGIFNKKSRRWSLRSRLTLMLILALLLFQIIMMFITMNMGLFPIMRQSVEDLSERLINTATHWTILSGEKKSKYEQYTQENAEFYFFNNKRFKTSHISKLIFNKLLSKTLTIKQGRIINIWSTIIAGKEFYWMDLNINQELIRIGFKHERIGTNPNAVFFALLSLNIIFSLLTAFIFVGYITQPLTNLLNAAKSLGRGIKPELKQKNNSREIQDLYDQFEKMSTEVQSLLENRNTLLIGISHELRTPITRLTLLLEMARDKLGDSNLNDCNQVLQEMNAIIGQFLSLGRGISVQKSTQINLNESMQNIIDSFSTNRINFESDYFGLIILPHDALRRVVLNLIDNALKYSENKPIDVKVESNKLGLTILVLDKGIGIPEDKIAQILQAFVRVNKDKHTNIKGVGLGLAISHLVAQTNGWSLAFSSRSDGGTIVKLNIPITAKIPTKK